MVPVSKRGDVALSDGDCGGRGVVRCCGGDVPSSASCASGHSVLRSLPPSGLRSLRNAPPQHRTTPRQARLGRCQKIKKEDGGVARTSRVIDFGNYPARRGNSTIPFFYFLMRK